MVLVTLPRVGAETGDKVGEEGEDGVDLGAGGVAADGEAEAACELGLGDSDGAEDVARLGRAGGASGTAGGGNPFEVEGDDQALAFDAAEGDVDVEPGGARRAGR